MEQHARDEIKQAGEFAAKAEKLVLSKQKFTMGDRITPLMAYWSLAFEFHNAILCLLDHQLHGAAFALVRPLLEATVRAHLVVGGSEATLARIRADEYQTNFATVGKEVDAIFHTEGLFENFLSDARTALHGYTHIGIHQLGRRFKDEALAPNYSEGEIIEVVRVSTSALFMVNAITTKTLEFESEWSANNDLLQAWNDSTAG